MPQPSTAEIWVIDGQGQRVRQPAGETVSDERLNAGAVRDRADAALDVNAAFLALASPTNAQVVTQVQRLTRECSALIRLLGRLLDDTSGT